MKPPQVNTYKQDEGRILKKYILRVTKFYDVDGFLEMP